MRFLIATAFSLFLSSAAFAWMPATQFQNYGNSLSVTVTNNTPGMAYCQGYIVGQLQTGDAVNSWFADWVGPWQFRTAYVYATPPFFFVNAWANLNCM
ncbi:MAG: hypothetical protein ACM3MG_08755 [Bacillota bacterium]